MRSAEGWLRALAVVMLACGLTVHMAAQAQPRSLYVSALDRSGVPAPNLVPSDLVVREDRVAREILSIVPAVEPLQIALLVDNSQAAESYIREYREALPAFISAVAADANGVRHQVSIITLADRPTVNTDYTSDASQLVKGAQRLFSVSGSGTYLLDGIRETVAAFRKREASRPVIVAVVTDGPELSDRHYDDVLRPLRASGAAFHVVVVGRPSNGSHDRAIVLSAGSRDTGGRYDNILAGTALTGRLKQVAAELTHQHKVTYARPASLIPPERITVSAARSGLTVRGTPVKDERQQGRP